MILLNFISFLHLVAPAERFLYGCCWDPTPESVGFPGANLIYHMKCLTLQTEDLLYIRNYSLTWFCKTCITELFSFNHIEHDDMFVSEVNNIGSCTRSIESLSDLLFNPFELNSDDHYSPLIDIDPDMNYYNENDSHIALNCDYYFEESILAAINDKIKLGILVKFFLCAMSILEA